ncbi:MAG: DUF4244 domain-containing protein [Actinomycetota bacterium]|nr:DUF4244 domain-containing protein [Actinomycetota bacterium]
MSKPVVVVARFVFSLGMVAVLGCLAICAAAGSAVHGRVRSSGGDAGMSTAEYAVGTIAACAFAAVLYQVVTGDSIVSALQDLIDSALSTLS